MNLRKLWVLALLASVSTMVLATVDLRTTIRDVFVEGSCEETGNITFSVTGDDFSNASTLEPVYIRLRLDHGAKLCKTLVWANSINPVDRTELPIFLPMNFEDRTALDFIAAPAETVSIVRWKAGEDEIWLRVQFPSGQWISRGGTFLAPSSTVRVRWTMGISAFESWQQNEDDFLAPGLANLPSATRDVLGLTPDDAVSTLICVDLTGSNLEPLPAPGEQSLLNFDPSAWDSSTQNVLGAVNSSQIILGRQLSTSFSDDRVIARGYDFNCQVTLAKRPPTAADLCAVTVADQQGVETFGVVCLSNNITVTVLCGRGWGFHQFSRVMLATEADAKYGFPVLDEGDVDPGIDRHPGNWIQLRSDAITLGGAAGSFPYAAASSVFPIQDGSLLAREARIQYLGTGTTGSFTFTLNATVCQWFEEPADDVILQLTILASNRDLTGPNGLVDVSPFEGWSGTSTPGFDQERACDPSLRLAGQLTWNFGFFRTCQAASCVRIFFPYVPRLRNVDPTVPVDFWAGLSFVNHGVADLNVVYANIYEADGAEWTVDFPDLAVRNQQTYAIWYDDAEGAVVFIDQMTGDVLSPVAQDGDLVFGDKRSSMFVVGCVTSVGDLSARNVAVDLDGYLIIGAGSSIDGAYIARNEEYVQTTQDGDLPVLFDKKPEDLKFHKIVGRAPTRSF
jgi:hypothetical protein